MPKTKTKTDALLLELASWTLEDLRDLQSALAGLIEASEDEQEQDRAASTAKGEKGSIELKWIKRNGRQYGPYRYLRYWEGKKLKSKYLGRLSSGDAGEAETGDG